MSTAEARTLPKTLGTFQRRGIAVGPVISGEHFGWSLFPGLTAIGYGWLLTTGQRRGEALGVTGA